MLNDCCCHSGTVIKNRCHPEDPSWKRCFMKEETTVYHIFNSMEVKQVDSVPWEEIQHHYSLDLSEIQLCKTIVKEELSFRNKMYTQ